MRLILQRVSGGAVTIEGTERREVGRGLVILAGIRSADTEEIAARMAEKAVNLRVFPDEEGRLNRSLLDIDGACLVVSNFTLYADCRKGRRPSFTEAAPPLAAEPLYEYLVRRIRQAGVRQVETGAFGADMLVEIRNDGPVTILLDSDEILTQQTALPGTGANVSRKPGA